MLGSCGVEPETIPSVLEGEGGVEGGRERKKERFHKEHKEMASASSWITASRPPVKTEQDRTLGALT